MKFIFLAFFPALVFAKSFLPSSFSARYENSFQSATGSKKKETGAIDYRFPRNVKLEVTGVTPTTYVTNGKTNWMYQPAFAEGEKGQVTISKGNSHSVIKFLDAIRGGVENSKYYASKENGKDLVMSFTPAGQKEFSLKMVTIHGTKPFKDVQSLKDVESIDLLDTNGLTKSLRFTELKEGVNFAPDHFVFSIPPGTKEIRN